MSSKIRKLKQAISKFWKNVDYISKVRQRPVPKDSPHIKTIRFNYVLNGKELYNDLIKSHDSVAIVLYNKTRQHLIFLRHFRPSVFYNTVKGTSGDLSNLDKKKYPHTLGVTLELCSGNVNKNDNLYEKAREKILEMCEYKVPVERLEEVLTYRFRGCKQRLYYCEVTDSDKSSSDCVMNGDKQIDIVEYSIDETRNFFKKGSENNCPQNSVLGIMWFLMNKVPEK